MEGLVLETSHFHSFTKVITAPSPRPRLSQVCSQTTGAILPACPLQTLVTLEMVARGQDGWGVLLLEPT